MTETKQKRKRWSKAVAVKQLTVATTVDQIREIAQKMDERGWLTDNTELLMSRVKELASNS